MQVLHAGGPEAPPTDRDRLGIPVYAENFRARAPKPFGMTAVSERRVHHSAGVARGNKHRSEKDRQVIGRTCIRHLGLERAETRHPVRRDGVNTRGERG